jgi:diphosphomevalonate decarboxylase
VIAVVESGPKEVSSREGHRRSASSPFFARRLELIELRLAEVRRAIQERDFERLGPVLEEEAIELHLIAMSSRPPIFYWKPVTLDVLQAVRDLRADGIPAYSTMDAGANVHVICPAPSEAAVAARLGEVPGVLELIRDGVGTGPTYDPDHLF